MSKSYIKVPETIVILKFGLDMTPSRRLVDVAASAVATGRNTGMCGTSNSLSAQLLWNASCLLLNRYLRSVVCPFATFMPQNFCVCLSVCVCAFFFWFVLCHIHKVHYILSQILAFLLGNRPFNWAGC